MPVFIDSFITRQHTCHFGICSCFHTAEVSGWDRDHMAYETYDTYSRVIFRGKKKRAPIQVHRLTLLDTNAPGVNKCLPENLSPGNLDKMTSTFSFSSVLQLQLKSKN